jgi:cellulose synthase/poly-beta-1,6-N-acetylglucosamine synthase-like glycosyltransferase
VTRSGLEGVSFVIPVLNGERHLEAVLQSVLAQADERPLEVIVVEDGSCDASVRILESLARVDPRLIVVQGPRRGAAAALNEGIRRATHPFICQVDQDVVLGPSWMSRLLEVLQDPTVAAAQGQYVTPHDGDIWSRVTGLDLENRYRALGSGDVDHVCTGNSIYRAEALRKVGLFDEALGYGYDNDMSYRLASAGYRLVFRPDARSVHRWRDGVWGFVRQQYGFGYGRLDVVAKHGSARARGDDVSGLLMMLHAPLMVLALLIIAVAPLLARVGLRSEALLLGAGIAAALSLERLVAGLRAALVFRNSAGLLFVPAHAVRDLAWAAAIVIWILRRLGGAAPTPSHSMQPRGAGRTGR